MNVLITLTGPTCTGKNAVQAELIRQGIPQVVSFTTRPPRDGEVEGEDYIFVDDNWVETMGDLDQFAEHVTYAGYHYGSTKQQVADAIARGNGKAVIIVDPVGAIQFAKAYAGDPNTTVFSVYIDNELDVLLPRFLQRFKDDSQATVKNYGRRLQQLLHDVMVWPLQHPYDYVVKQMDDAKGVSVLTVAAAIKQQLVERGLISKKQIIHARPPFSRRGGQAAAA